MIRTFSFFRGPLPLSRYVRNKSARPSFVELAGVRVVLEPNECHTLEGLPAGESALTLGDGVEFVLEPPPIGPSPTVVG